MRYKDLIYYILEGGTKDFNKRTGCYTTRLFGQSVSLNYYNDIFCPRKIYPKISAAEAVWMLRGSNSTAWLNLQTSIWKKFEDRPGIINTAYGFRWRHAFDRDQLQEAIDLLKKDPSTRQALVLAWDPRTDGLLNQGKAKNVPCPFAFSLYISEERGQIVVYQRSCDVMAGLPYDLMTYYIIGQAIFNSVGVPFYGVNILIGDAHIYEQHVETAVKITRSEDLNENHRLGHPYTVNEILQSRDTFMEHYIKLYVDINFEIENRLEVAQ